MITALAFGAHYGLDIAIPSVISISGAAYYGFHLLKGNTRRIYEYRIYYALLIVASGVAGWNIAAELGSQGPTGILVIERLEQVVGCIILMALFIVPFRIAVNKVSSGIKKS